MLKKILIFLFIFTFFGISSYSFANEEGGSQQEEVKASICDKKPNSIVCPGFKINTSDFSPGSKKILEKARAGGGDTKKSAQEILNVILKNLMIVFGSISMLIITIGGGMMIFHSGNDGILTKGKSMLKWGFFSIAIALSSGIIIKLVAFLLY